MWDLLVLDIGWSRNLVKEEGVREKEESKTILSVGDNDGAINKIRKLRREHAWRTW